MRTMLVMIGAAFAVLAPSPYWVLGCVLILAVT